MEASDLYFLLLLLLLLSLTEHTGIADGTPLSVIALGEAANPLSVLAPHHLLRAFVVPRVEHPVGGGCEILLDDGVQRVLKVRL